jgi:hypothetical protein
LLDSDPHYHWSGILYSLRGSVATVLSGVTWKRKVSFR